MDSKLAVCVLAMCLYLTSATYVPYQGAIVPEDSKSSDNIEVSFSSALTGGSSSSDNTEGSSSSNQDGDSISSDNTGDSSSSDEDGDSSSSDNTGDSSSSDEDGDSSSSENTGDSSSSILSNSASFDGLSSSESSQSSSDSVCDVYPNVKYGKLTYSNLYRLDSTVRCTCNTGYVLKNPSCYFTCNSDGHWHRQGLSDFICVRTY